MIVGLLATLSGSQCSQLHCGGPAPGAWHREHMDELVFSDSIIVPGSPESVYDLISDVTRMGAWSPICTACWWDEGQGPQAGSWFTGRNEVPGRTWETRSLVTVAERGREFSFLVGGSLVQWSYTLAPVPEGTELTESWEFRPEGIALFHERYGDDAGNQIAIRTAAAHEGIPVTLAAIGRTVQALADLR